MKNKWVLFFCVCFFALFVPVITHAQSKTATVTSTPLVYGKYGCTASSYSGGFVQYSPKGSFVIEKNGRYTYNGFKKPSTGTFTVDKQGNLLFKGGYFDGGKAE